jgi:biotin carboxyl carrier protein
MDLIAASGEREERVRVERVGDSSFLVQLGDQSPVLVDARAVDGGSLWSLLVDGVQYAIALHRDGDGTLSAFSAGGVRQALTVADPLTFLARRDESSLALRGASRVTAYMPGRVVALLVAAGDTVIAGQGLLVLEAMKMQNEIQAERAGRVSRVCVTAGQAVDGGEVLFEFS